MSTTVSARLPDELLAWMKQQPEKTNNELILNALYALKELRSGGRMRSVDGPDPNEPEWARKLTDAIEALTEAIGPATKKVQSPAPIELYENEQQQPEPIYKAKRPARNHHELPPEPIDTTEADLENATANFVSMFG